MKVLTYWGRLFRKEKLSFSCSHTTLFKSEKADPKELSSVSICMQKHTHTFKHIHQAIQYYTLHALGCCWSVNNNTSVRALWRCWLHTHFPSSWGFSSFSKRSSISEYTNIYICIHINSSQGLGHAPLLRVSEAPSSENSHINAKT